MKRFFARQRRIFFVWLNLLCLLLTFCLPLSHVKSAQAKKQFDLIPKTKFPFDSFRNGDETKSSSLKLPLQFEVNKGQHNPQIKFSARTSGFDLMLRQTGVVFVLSNGKDRLTRFQMGFAGANEKPLIKGIDELYGKVNYFIGNNRNKWQSNVSTFSRVRYENLYKGVNLIWYENTNKELEYDFTIAPKSDYKQIKLTFDGAEKLEIDAEGNLLIHTSAGVIKQRKPVSYQEINGKRKEIESSFVIRNPKSETRNQIVGVIVEDYDDTKELIIDPTLDLNKLAASTYLGGQMIDVASTVQVDSQGNVYVVGTTVQSSGVTNLFPVTAGAFDTTSNGSGNDVFVTKLNSNLTQIIYSTFIGGDSIVGGGGNSPDDTAHDIAIDANGNAFIVGVTSSPDFPTTAGVIDAATNGRSSAFITKLNSTGSALIYSTYLNGTETVAFNGPITDANTIAIDSSGNAYIGGFTASPTFATTTGAFDTTFNSTGINIPDAFVTKINSTGTAVMYSTYIGGNSEDRVTSLVIDSSGNAYAVGWSQSTAASFPFTAGAFNQGGTSFNGFVTKINPDGTALIFSSRIGGSTNIFGSNGLTFCSDVLLDAQNNIYVSGHTTASNFPTTPGAFDTAKSDGTSDAFIAKLNSAGTALIFSTYLGGTDENELHPKIALDDNLKIYVFGVTRSIDFPTTANAFDKFLNVGNNFINGFTTRRPDFFLSRFNATASQLEYSSYLGGGFEEGFNAIPTSGNIDSRVCEIAIDSAGFVYVAGGTESANYPVTIGALQPLFNGNRDAVITKFGGNALLTRHNQFDFDGDGTPDFAVYRDGIWFINQSSSGFKGLQWGVSTDKLAPADYDGDGVTDVAVFRDGIWFILRSSDNTLIGLQWGVSGDLPVPADYDGDGKDDIAVWRPAPPTQASYFILQSSNNQARVNAFGQTGDVPLIGDFDSDGKYDPAVYRNAAQGPQSFFFFLASANNPNNNITFVPFGIDGDRPVIGDYDGDNKIDFAVFRPSNRLWFVRQSSNNQTRAELFGLSTDKLVPGDYDGDGKTDKAVYRDGTWWVQNSNGSVTIFQFGLANDKPVPASFLP